MSCLEDCRSDCGCRYTLTLMNEIVQKQSFEMKDSFNHVPSIHEVDEEETDEEDACDEQDKSCKDAKQSPDLTKDTADVDSIYSNDSFCSDESCDESEEVNGTSRTINESYSSPQITERKHNEEDGEAKNEQEGRENIKAISEITNSARQSSMSEDYTIGTKQIRRRRNMSFTDEEMRKIDWENQILLRKIMAQQKPKEKFLRENASLPRISSSAINRKKLQKKIENENMVR